MDEQQKLAEKWAELEGFFFVAQEEVDKLEKEVLWWQIAALTAGSLLAGTWVFFLFMVLS